MVETAHGGRKWAGRNTLRDNFLRGTLKVNQGDEELTTEESEKHISSFAFKPTKELPHHAGHAAAVAAARDDILSHFPQSHASSSSADAAGARSQDQRQLPPRSSTSSAPPHASVSHPTASSSSTSSKISPSSSGLEEGTVVGIQAFTLPSDSASAETPSSSTQSLNNASFLSSNNNNNSNNNNGASGNSNHENQDQHLQSSSSSCQPAGSQSSSASHNHDDHPFKGSPRKDLNSDFLDDATGAKREEAGKPPAGAAAPPLPQAPLLASVSEQIRYMYSQLKMTPDQITNVLGLPLTYVQNQVILLNSVSRSGAKSNAVAAAAAAAAAVASSEGAGDFASPSQVCLEDGVDDAGDASSW